MKDILPQAERFWQSYSMRRTGPDKRNLAAFSVYPTAETNAGFLHLVMSPTNIAALYALPEESAEAFVREALAAGEPGRGWGGWFGANFHTLEQVQEFDRRYRGLVATSQAAAARIPE